jgi:hypothetical protein
MRGGFCLALPDLQAAHDAASGWLVPAGRGRRPGHELAQPPPPSPCGCCFVPAVAVAPELVENQLETFKLTGDRIALTGDHVALGSLFAKAGNLLFETFDQTYQDG